MTQVRSRQIEKARKARQLALCALACLLAGASSGCAGLRSLFGTDQRTGRNIPIENPFQEYYTAAQRDPSQTIILRTKKGDRAVEVELPGGIGDMTDFTVPVAPAFREQSRAPASSGPMAIDESYRGKRPSYTDREIMGTFPQHMREDEGRIREIEGEMGLAPTEDSAPERDESYLASLDKIKQLYKLARFEAALLEIDTLLPKYQTDPRLHKMRGTILDRMGYTELAIKSWMQALRFEPNNRSLQRLIDRRRRLAGGVAP